MRFRRAAVVVTVLAACGLVLLVARRGARNAAPPADPDPTAFADGRMPLWALSGTPRSGGTLLVRANGEPATLNPAVSADAWPRRIALHQVLESLVTQDPRDHPRYRVIPSLATSWEESPDHLTVTYHLRPGVVWHDGAPFDASDVVFTLDLLRDPQVDSEHLREYLVDVRSVTAPDPATVVVTYARPYVWAVRRMSEIPILPRHLLVDVPPADLAKAPFSRAPVGTGPFRFVSWEPKQSVTLARWDRYWGPKAHVDQVVFRMIPEASAAWQLLLRGDLDIDFNLNADQYAAAADDPKIRGQYQRVKYFDSRFGLIAWNLERPLFADPRVRRALAMFLDRPTLGATIYRGQPRLSACVNYQDSPGCDPATAAPAFDPAGARKLLEAAGFADHDGDGLLDRDGVPFRFSISFQAGAPTNEELLLAYKQELYKAGIELDLQKLEWALFTPRLRDHDFDGALFSMLDDPENDPFQMWHSSQARGGSNYTQYRSASADALIEQIRGTFDDSARGVLLARLNQTVVDDQPMALLFDFPSRALVNRRVRGAYVSPTPGFQYQDIWLEPEAR